MPLERFNHQDAAQLKQFLQHCVHIPRWAEEISAARPFTSATAVLAFAKQQAHTWTWDEVLGALNTHPRIGEKKAQAELSAQEQAFSAREQAAAHTHDHTLQAALYAGNVAYEQRFGYIFLIKAAGLTSHDILAALQRRLTHDPHTEQQIVKQQLIAIALLRLEQEFSHD